MNIVAAVQEPLSPRVVERLAVMVARQRELEAEVADLALSEFLDPKVKSQRQKLEGELAKVSAEVSRLRLAREQAEARDQRAADEVEIAGLEAGLVEFEKVAAARTEAAQQFDRAAELLNEAWCRLHAASELITAVVPAGCHLPRGFVAANLRQLAKAAVYRHSSIGTPGDEANALPLGEPPSLAMRYQPASIPSAAETIGGESDWMVETVRRQIQMTTQFRRGELGEVA